MTDLEKELDRLWGQVVSVRDRYRCRLCGERGVDPHHIFGRSQTVRWVVENGAYLCRNCHRLVTDSPRPPELWRVLLVPDREIYERLEALRYRPGSYKVDMEAMRAYLETELRNAKDRELGRAVELVGTV